MGTTDSGVLVQERYKHLKKNDVAKKVIVTTHHSAVVSKKLNRNGEGRIFFRVECLPVGRSVAELEHEGGCRIDRHS